MIIRVLLKIFPFFNIRNVVTQDTIRLREQGGRAEKLARKGKLIK